MFYLIGLGLKPMHLTLEALNVTKRCSKVFFESYTSRYSEGSIAELEGLCGRRFVGLDRADVEERFERLLYEAKHKDIALLVFGNPLNATTHVQLLLDARRLGVKAVVLPGLSVFDFLGVTGLDPYKFGRVCSIVFQRENFAPESFYDVIERNFGVGLHSLCLLDFDAESNSFMCVREALDIIAGIEQRRGGEILKRAVLVGLYGLGSRVEMVRAGTAIELKRFSFGAFPQSLVIAGKLNDKEKEALRALGGWNG